MSKSKQAEPKRFFVFEGTDVRLEIIKAIAINADIDFIFHLDRIDGNKCRLTYNATIFPDFSKITNVVIERE